MNSSPARPSEKRAHSARRDGHVEAISDLDGAHAPQASILFDKFHVLRHLGDALDQIRKSEYARVSGRDRRFIKGQKYTLLARRPSRVRFSRWASSVFFWPLMNRRSRPDTRAYSLLR